MTDYAEQVSDSYSVEEERLHSDNSAVTISEGLTQFSVCKKTLALQLLSQQVRVLAPSDNYGIELIGIARGPADRRPPDQSLRS